MSATLQLHTLTVDDYVKDITNTIHTHYQQLLHSTPPTIRLKILSLGHSATGKSCLIKRYCEGKFIARYIYTIGVDYGVRKVMMNRKNYEVINNSNSQTVQPNDILNISIHFLDVAGGEEYTGIRDEFHTQTSGILLVFDVNDRNTYEKLEGWVVEHQQCAPGSSALQSVVVCGNKIDDTTNKRQVTTAEAQSWCKQRNFTYMETSANTGANVNEAFDALFKSVVQRQQRDPAT